MVRIEIDIQEDESGIGINVIDYRLIGDGEDAPTKCETIVADDLQAKIEKELSETYHVPVKDIKKEKGEEE